MPGFGNTEMNTMSVHSLQQSASRDSALRDELLRRFPTLAEDEQALLDTLDGVSDLDRQVLAVLRSADNDEMLAAGIEHRLDELQARKARLDERSKSKRAAILHAMDHAGRKKIELPDGTVSVVPTRPSVIITDETKVPRKFFKPQPAKLSKADIKAALDAGKKVAGAMLSNVGITLSVRRN
jgi:hypothetical protein